MDKLAEVRKFLVTALGSLVSVLTFTHNIPFLPTSVSVPVGVALAVVTSFLTWLVPNKEVTA